MRLLGWLRENKSALRRYSNVICCAIQILSIIIINTIITCVTVSLLTQFVSCLLPVLLSYVGTFFWRAVCYARYTSTASVDQGLCTNLGIRNVWNYYHGIISRGQCKICRRVALDWSTGRRSHLPSPFCCVSRCCLDQPENHFCHFLSH